MLTAHWRKDGRGVVLDVWCDGWRIAFPAAGEPRVERGVPAPDAMLVDEVALERAGDRLNMRVGGWFVSFGDGEPRPTPPPRRDDVRRYRGHQP